MQKFDRYMQDIYKNEEKLLQLLMADVKSVVAKEGDFSDSLFTQRGSDIKFALQANQSLFWKLWDFLETYKQKKEKPSKELKPYIKTLKKEGICVIKNFFDADEVQMITDGWETSMEKIPDSIENLEAMTLKNRFYFYGEKDFGYAIGSKYDGKKRFLYYTNAIMPDVFKKLLRSNDFFNAVVAGYYGLEDSVMPSAVMAEHLLTPSVKRKDTAWHIDNLSDQFKVMVVLNDMDKDDAPFTYVTKTHKIKKYYKDRYHKMYAINGLTTQEHNHFEESFTDYKSAKQGILSKGDVVLFDCKIHHTATFAQNGGERKNIMLYYSSVPTLKNKFLFKIDKYLNFGLR